MSPVQLDSVSASDSSSRSSAPSPDVPPRRFSFDSRYVAPLFITLILILAQLHYGVLESLDRTALAIAASVVTEIVLSRLLRGKWPHLASAYISGISVGILLRSPEVWPYIL